MYTPFSQSSFCRSNTAGLARIRSRLNLPTSSPRPITSVESSSDQPSRARKFTMASARYPASRYHSADVAPCRLLSFERSGPRMMGRCTSAGISNPSAAYSS